MLVLSTYRDGHLQDVSNELHDSFEGAGSWAGSGAGLAWEARRRTRETEQATTAGCATGLLSLRGRTRALCLLQGLLDKPGLFGHSRARRELWAAGGMGSCAGSALYGYRLLSVLRCRRSVAYGAQENRAHITPSQRVGTLQSLRCVFSSLRGGHG